MKKVSVLIFICAVVILINGGCKALDVFKPIDFKKKQQAEQKKRYEEREARKDPDDGIYLPDGSATGLNPYEQRFINSIDKDFKRQERKRSRQVFGFGTDK